MAAVTNITELDREAVVKVRADLSALAGTVCHQIAARRLDDATASARRLAVVAAQVYDFWANRCRLVDQAQIDTGYRPADPDTESILSQMAFALQRQGQRIFEAISHATDRAGEPADRLGEAMMGWTHASMVEFELSGDPDPSHGHRTPGPSTGSAVAFPPTCWTPPKTSAGRTQLPEATLQPASAGAQGGNPPKATA